jgi:hypothetical protein
LDFFEFCEMATIGAKRRLNLNDQVDLTWGSDGTNTIDFGTGEVLATNVVNGVATKTRVATKGYVDNAIQALTFVTPSQLDSLAGIVSSLSSLEGTDVSNLTSITTTLSGRVDANTSDISDLQSGLASTNTAATTLSSQVSGLQSSINNLTGLSAEQITAISSISGISSDVSTLQSDVSTLQSDVSTLSGQTSTNSSDISTLQSEFAALPDVSGLPAQVSALSTTVSGYNSQFTEHYGWIVGLQARDVETRVNMQQAQKSTVNSVVCQLQTQVQRLYHSLFPDVTPTDPLTAISVSKVYRPALGMISSIVDGLAYEGYFYQTDDYLVKFTDGTYQLSTSGSDPLNHLTTRQKVYLDPYDLNNVLYTIPDPLLSVQVIESIGINYDKIKTTFASTDSAIFKFIGRVYSLGNFYWLNVHNSTAHMDGALYDANAFYIGLKALNNSALNGESGYGPMVAWSNLNGYNTWDAPSDQINGLQAQRNISLIADRATGEVQVIFTLFQRLDASDIEKSNLFTHFVTPELDFLTDSENTVWDYMHEDIFHYNEQVIYPIFDAASFTTMIPKALLVMKHNGSAAGVVDLLPKVTTLSTGQTGYARVQTQDYKTFYLIKSSVETYIIYFDSSLNEGSNRNNQVYETRNCMAFNVWAAYPLELPNTEGNHIEHVTPVSAGELNYSIKNGSTLRATINFTTGSATIVAW